MSEKENKRVKPQRQSWRPHWTVEILLKLWKIVFGASKIIVGAAATVLIIFGICLGVLAGSVGDYLESEVLPYVETDTDNYALDLNSYVYYMDEAGDIEKLQNLYAENNRDWVDYENIPEDLLHATISIEDKRFFEHQGVDWITTIKACFFMFFGNGDRGGSTITQQLVKNVTDNWAVTVQRKVQEIFTALEYEKRYSKEDIMEWYLNEIYMGNRANGVKRAAAIYFGKELESLTIAECASLISITNNPSLYNPYRENLDAGGMTGAQRNKDRQMDTLGEMLNQGWITQEEYDEAAAQELVFKRGIDLEDTMAYCTNEVCGYKGIVSTLVEKENGKFFCPDCNTAITVSEDASRTVYSYYVDTVIEDVAQALAERDGVEWNNSSKKFYKQLISRSGYHIYSCLDMKAQDAVDAVYTDLSKIPATRGGQQLQSAVVVVDNRTGDIVAMAGGVGKEKEHDGFNRATDAALQTGSSTKPLAVYAPGFESGAFTPATVVLDLPIKYSGATGWPKNDNRKYEYSLTIHDGFRRSINAVAVNALSLAGTTYAYNFAKDRFGISGLTDRYIAADGEVKSDIDYAPLALGALTVGASVRDMAVGFAAIANNGVYREGRTFTKVYDNDGNLVLDNTQESHTVYSNKTANYMHYCLSDAANFGTGTEARIDGQYIYGKTGTTSSNKDRWFCGYTGYYSAAVWCGYDQPEVINMAYGAGNNPSAILWRRVLTPLHKGLPRKSLTDYSGMVTVTMCLDSGMLATDACRNDIRVGEGFTRLAEARVYKDQAPNQVCNKHVEVEYCTTGKGVANEFCKLFAEKEPEVKIEKKSLVKLTAQEIEALYKASKTGLYEIYAQNNMVYQITKNGQDDVFKGIDGKLNQKVKAPYVVCPVHTEEAWKEYVAAHETTAPTEAVVPEETIDPNTPEAGNPDDGAVG